MNIDQYIPENIRKLFSKEVPTSTAVITLDRELPDVSEKSFEAKLLGVKRGRHFMRIRMEFPEGTLLPQRVPEGHVDAYCSHEAYENLVRAGFDGEAPLKFKVLNYRREATIRIVPCEEDQATLVAA